MFPECYTQNELGFLLNKEPVDGPYFLYLGFLYWIELSVYQLRSDKISS